MLHLMHTVIERRLPRRTRTVGGVLTTTGANQEFLGPNPDRIGFVVDAVTTAITITQDRAATFAQGITAFAGVVPLEFWIDQWGTAVREPWYLVGSGAGGFLLFTEIIEIHDAPTEEE